VRERKRFQEAIHISTIKGRNLVHIE
jgi:hypothetical protein